MRWFGWSLLLVASCTRDVRPAPATGPASQATLFISSELKGYLGPCGCSESMRGGIDRAAFVVAQARDAGTPVAFIDTGNALFGAPLVPDEAVPQQEEKARTLARAFTFLGVSAVAVGPLDDARGPSFRTGLGLPEAPPEAITAVRLTPTVEVALIRASTFESMRTSSQKARSEGRARALIGLFEGPFDEAMKGALLEGLELDLLVATRGRDELSTEENRLVSGRVPVVQLQSKGRSLLRVDLFLRDASRLQWLRSPSETQRELDALAQRIELLRAQVNDPSLSDELQALKRAKLEEVIARREALAAAPVPVPESGNAASLRFVPLETSFPTLPEVTALVTAYDRTVGELNLTAARAHGRECAPVPDGGAGYIGNGLCAACHPHAARVWEGTRHARAHDSLVAKGRQNHLDCVGCHVTAWGQPGGVCRLDRVEGKTHVGCEACHGPGSLHLAQPTKATIAKGTEVCGSCHDRENSPHFELTSYLPRLLGPGHGQPVPAEDAGVSHDAGTADAGVKRKKR